MKEEKLPDIPKLTSTGSIGTLSLTEQCRLSDALADGVTSPVLPTMETLSQSTGFLLYRTHLQGPVEGELNLGEVKDRVLVLLDGELQGASGRSTNGAPIPLKVPAGNHKLELLVENMGRINFGGKMLEERKGLIQPVLFAGSELGPFEHIGLPMQEAPDGDFKEIEDGKTHGSSTLYRGQFKTASPCDTFLDMRGFGRGIVWLNGRNLGRYWQVGPSQSIYLPGCWMKLGEENVIVVLELEAKTCLDKVPTTANAIWGNAASR